MDRIERNIPQGDTRVIPQFDVGNVVDLVDANHYQRVQMSFYANFLTTTRNASRCHTYHCFTTFAESSLPSRLGLAMCQPRARAAFIEKTVSGSRRGTEYSNTLINI